MTKHKLIAREPTKEMVAATRFAQDDEHYSDAEMLRRVFDAAPDIETEAEKKALNTLAHPLLCTREDLKNIIYALLRERGKV